MADIELSVQPIVDTPKGVEKLSAVVENEVRKGALKGLGILSQAHSIVEKLVSAPETASSRVITNRYVKTFDSLQSLLSQTPVTEGNKKDFFTALSLLRSVASGARSVGNETGNLALFEKALSAQVFANEAGKSATAQLAQTQRDRLQEAASVEYAKTRSELFFKIWNTRKSIYGGTLDDDSFRTTIQSIRNIGQDAITEGRAAGLTNKELRTLRDSINKLTLALTALYKRTGGGGDGKQEPFADSILGKVINTGAAVGAVNLSTRIADYFANEYKDFYGNRETPFTSRRAQRAGAIQNIGSSISKWIGRGIAVAGVLGAGVTGGASLALVPAGMAVGAAGTWYSGERERTIAAADSSKLDALEQRRWRSLYSDRTNGWQFARMLSATGFVSTGDIEAMTSQANTFNTAAAFGGVSSSQYLALSMMPNYYAALVSNADDATRLAAYQADMNALGPGAGAYFSQMAGIPENVRALVASGALNMAMNDLGAAQYLEATLGKYEEGYVVANYLANRENVTSRARAWAVGANTSDRFNYAPAYGRAVSETYAGMSASLESLGFREFVNGRATDSNLTKRDIIINIDTTEAVRLEGVYTDDDLLKSYIQYSAGSIS